MIDTFFRTIDSGDLCSPLLLLAFLFAIGLAFADRIPGCVAIGKGAGSVAFVLYLTYRLWKDGSLDSSQLSPLPFRGLVFAGFVMALVWIALTAAFYLRVAFAVGLVRPAQRRWAVLRNWRQKRKDRRLAEADRQRRESEYQRSEPDRQRDRLEAEERTKRLADEQRRREDARLVCRLRYDLAAPEIGERFPREQFERYIAEHLGDQVSAEQVERRSQQILDLLHQHVQKVEPSLPASSLAELTQSYEQRLREIEAVPDERLRNTLLVELRSQYFNLAGRLLEKAVP